MAIFRLGSQGEEVRAIQQKLAAEGLYRGPVDGDFGGGTHAAVVQFQGRRGLEADGKVGPLTWAAMFGGEPPEPAIVSADLAQRCLALTGSFETGKGAPECFCGITGDFDGQGISLGVLQWNFGQGSLQPLLQDMIRDHEDVMRGVFGGHYPAFATALQCERDELLEFARSVQHPVRHTVYEPWYGFARTLGRTPEFQAVQARHAGDIFRRALGLCGRYGVWSERAAALMFDICVQNGSIGAVTHQRILAEIAALPAALDEAARELRSMEIVANRRAEAANPRWIDDVRTRKLTIARGTGTVHGIGYDLEEQFGIGLRRFAA